MATTTSTSGTGSAADIFAALNGTSSTTKSKSTTEAMEDRFLTLLMTQIKNQDPLNPLDNAQVTTQLAQINTVNGIERLNQEIRRRERVIRIFPNEASAIRLIGALLIEQDEKWSTGRKYFEMDVYYNSLIQEEKTENQVA